MNGDIYDEIRKQYKDAKTPKERQKCIWTMLCMIGTNHLPHIEERIEKRDRKINKKIAMIFGFLIAILLRLIGGLF